MFRRLRAARRSSRQQCPRQRENASVCVVMARRGCMRVRATVLAHVLGDVSMYVGLGSVALGARLCLELTTRVSEPA